MQIYSLIIIISITIVLTLFAHLRNMDWQDEVRMWEDVIQKNPKEGRSFNALGWYYLKRGDYQRAIFNFIESIKRHPYYADLYRDLGIAYETSGDLDRAIEAYSTAVYLGKKDVKIMVGIAYFKKLDITSALRELEDVLSLDPLNAKALFWTGLSYRAKGDYMTSARYLEKAISLEPDNETYRLNLEEIKSISTTQQ